MDRQIVFQAAHDFIQRWRGAAPPEDQGQSSAWSSMTRNLLFVVASLFLWGIGEGSFMVFQTIYLEQWGASAFQIGAIVSGWGSAMAIAQIPAGYLADRRGPRLANVGYLGAWHPVRCIDGRRQQPRRFCRRFSDLWADILIHSADEFLYRRSADAGRWNAP